MVLFQASTVGRTDHTKAVSEIRSWISQVHRIVHGKYFQQGAIGINTAVQLAIPFCYQCQDYP